MAEDQDMRQALRRFYEAVAGAIEPAGVPSPTDIDAARNRWVWASTHEDGDYTYTYLMDTPVLLAEIDRLRADLAIANEATVHLGHHLATFVNAGRKLRGFGFAPTHRGGCIGGLSTPECDCGVTDVCFAVMLFDGL